MSQQRVARGVPTGGQFAATGRGESGVSLDGDAEVGLTPAQARMLRLVRLHDAELRYDTRNKTEMRMLHVLADRGLIEWDYDPDEDWGERMYAWPVADAEPDRDEQEPAPDWRDQPIMVEGRRFTLGDVHGGRLFHGSPHRLEPGTVLEPGAAEANFAESAGQAVSITSLANYGLYWAREAGGEEQYVYEVEPLGTVGAWRSSLANYGQSINLYEGRVAQARIVAVVPVEEARAYERNLVRSQRQADPPRTQQT